MATLLGPPPQGTQETVDHCVLFRGLTWSDYERLLEVRGEAAIPRMTYLEGDLELMSPSRGHEGVARCIGRLFEAWADENDIEVSAFGSWTLKSAPRERGLEPDECYVVGDPEERETPDLSLEVEWTRGLLDKLEVYRGLGVPEVWIWRQRTIEVQVLRGDRYERAERSALFPGLDLQAMARHLDEPNQSRAVRAFRAWLRRKPS